MSNTFPTRLDGQVVIVTGGSQGVGLGIARAFLDAGSTVIACARSTFDRPPAARGDDELARCRHISADVRDHSQIQTVVDAAVVAAVSDVGAAIARGAHKAGVHV